MAQTTFTTKIDYPNEGMTLVNAALLTEYDNAIHALEALLDPDTGEVSENLIPSVNNTYDLGSVTKQWKNLYLSGAATITGAVVSKTDTLVKPFLVVGMSGAVDYACDGVADDVQIQAALDAALAAGGGTVFVKNEAYQITATLNMNGYSNVNLVGDGWGTIFEVAVEDEFVYLANASNVILKDFAVDCNGYYSTPNVDPVFIAVCSNVVVDHIYVHDTQMPIDNSAASIGGDRLINSTIKNCLVKNVTDYGISIHAAERCTIINNFIWNPANHGIFVGYGAYGNGDYERAKYNVIVGNCIYSDGSGTDSNGIKLTKADYTTVSNNTISHSTAISALGHGITTDDYDPAADAIANNTNYQSHNVYSNNTIYNFAFGIYLNGENDSVISNNTITVTDVNNSKGISVGPQVTGNATPIYSTRIKIEGNTIEYMTPQTHSSGVVGIYIEALNTHCKIDGNSVYYCGGRSIIVGYQANYTTIVGNTVKDSYEYGIVLGYPYGSGPVLYGASYCAVENNIVTGSSRSANNTGYDILLYAGSTYNSIIGNQCIAVETNKAYANIISQSNCNYNTIIGNTVVGGVTAKILIVGTGNEYGHNPGY